MRIFDLWLTRCKECDSQIFCIHGSGETAIYQTKKAYECKYHTFYTSPVYHVFIHGEWLLATLSYLQAVELYRSKGFKA